MSLCGWKGLELPLLSVLGPSSAGLPVRFLLVEVGEVGSSPVFLMCSVFENGWIALGPYRHLFKFLLPHSG